MSAAKRGGRFSYLNSAEENTQPTASTAAERSQDKKTGSLSEHDDARNKTDGSAGGGEERSRPSSGQELTSVPKGKGRMKQERSQLNVRIPTTLKRQASAKAVLEGRDIGEVVEELLREYLDR
jgi:hypothetical protein